MENYELFKGLPQRTIQATDLDGNDRIFGVTTEMVNDLITAYFNTEKNEDEVYEFDSSYSYAIPQELFENGYDDEVIAYINENIDDNFILESDEK